jgi:hypothetical protein
MGQGYDWGQLIGHLRVVHEMSSVQARECFSDLMSSPP